MNADPEYPRCSECGTPEWGVRLLRHLRGVPTVPWPGMTSGTRGCGCGHVTWKRGPSWARSVSSASLAARHDVILAWALAAGGTTDSDGLIALPGDLTPGLAAVDLRRLVREMGKKPRQPGPAPRSRAAALPLPGLGGGSNRERGLHR